ncbi:uncharacterized protein LOC122854723 isoform X2 [Aphidius gifuensis]|nr:uncharacterized protein LOC122854723 isoform X2 [Aphidius gifuensis]
MDSKENIDDQIATQTQNIRAQSRSDDINSTAKNFDSNNQMKERSQEPRFGFTNIGSTASGYGVSNYGPGKVDLGGLVLGAVIGIGTILIIPKILYVISGSYGAYARNDDSGIVNSMTKIEDILARNGIDTTSCMQRAVCTYTKKSSETISSLNDIDYDDKISSFDRMIESITTNQLFRTAMRGTAVQEAIEAGKSGQSCTKIYPQCGFSIDTLMSIASNILIAIKQSDTAHSTTQSDKL